VRARFLLDEQISPRVAGLLGRSGVDVRAVAGSGLEGGDDPTVFHAAVSQGRILVTYDIEDMSRILSDLLKEGLPVPGVVFVDARTIPPSDLAGLARAIRRVAAAIASGRIQPGGGIFLQR
jgi:predicted nuclease of predicted toxin-antitoxin system